MCGQAIFPSVSVVSLLLECGAGALVRNEARSTALHVAAIPYNFSSALVDALLAGGAHLDQPNKFGDLPAKLVALNRGSRVKVRDPLASSRVTSFQLPAGGTYVCDVMIEGPPSYGPSRYLSIRIES